MTRAEKTYYCEIPTKAYISAFGGIEIKDIIYDIEDYVVFIANAWGGTWSVHKAKIHYSDDPYFMFKGVRLHFNEALRV